MSIQLTRRPATTEDVPFLMRLRRQTMDTHLSASGANTDDDDHLARLMYRFDCAEVLLQDGAPVGLLKVSRDSAQWKLIQIQLVPELQGQGLGADLLVKIIAEADNANAAIALSVLKANPARALYERLKFCVIGELNMNLTCCVRPNPSLNPHAPRQRCARSVVAPASCFR
jgi:ribosomal protein S18 acetylase RimI-like enzyme